MGYMEEYRKWMESPALTAEEHAELAALEGNEKEIQERFFAPLSFGTAGLRGTMGIGLYKMNRFTVGAATQGLANLIKKERKDLTDQSLLKFTQSVDKITSRMIVLTFYFE